MLFILTLNRITVNIHSQLLLDLFFFRTENIQCKTGVFDKRLLMNLCSIPTFVRSHVNLTWSWISILYPMFFLNQRKLLLQFHFFWKLFYIICKLKEMAHCASVFRKPHCKSVIKLFYSGYQVNRLSPFSHLSYIDNLWEQFVYSFLGRNLLLLVSELVWKWFFTIILGMSR